MKKSLAILLTAVCLMTTSAFALTRAQINTGDALHSLGLFKGTDKGYELNLQLKRSDGITLLVRLLGKENDALSGKYTHPFTDVAEWLDPYVACAYNAGYTKGVSEKTYGSDKAMTRAEYYTMVLRALGYTDQGETADFTLDTAVEFAATLGLSDSDQQREKFSRADAIELFWKALSANLKGKGQTLAESLIARGVFTSSELDEARKLQSNPYPNEEMVVSERTGNLITRRQAIVDKTAYAFWDKHMDTDYDQRSMIQASALSNVAGTTFRENRSQPEWASEEHRLFLDCSGFVFATYHEIFGEEMRNYFKWYNTTNMETWAEDGTTDDVIYFHRMEGTTTEEYARVIAEMKALLEPGDAIIYRRATSGHTIMYMDGGNTLESTGNSYYVRKGVESEDPLGTVRLRVLDNYAFNLGSSTCLFAKNNITSIAILRPLNVVPLEPSARSQARLDMGRIALSKLSVMPGQTVEQGESITFKIVLDNQPESDTSKDLVVNVTDPLPTNVRFVSADNGGQLIDGVVTWNNVSVANNEVKTLSYTVSVTASEGLVSSGTTRVNGIDFTYRDLQIGKKMTASQLQTLKDELAKGMPADVTPLAYVNSLYKSAVGNDLGVETVDDIIDALFDPKMDSNNNYRYQVAVDKSTNVGAASVLNYAAGRRVINITKQDYQTRARYLHDESFQLGDVLMIQDLMLRDHYYIYLGGTDFVKIDADGMTTENIDTALEAVMAYRFFALLRPSMI